MNETLEDYLREVRAAPLLLPAEEREVLIAARQGDDAAYDRLLEGYLELTALLAFRLSPDWLDPFDAIQEANLVLFRLIGDDAVTRPVVELTGALIAHFRRVEDSGPWDQPPDSGWVGGVREPRSPFPNIPPTSSHLESPANGSGIDR